MTEAAIATLPPAGAMHRSIDALATVSVAIAGTALLGLVLVQAW